jgi:hypothetical protein
MPAKADIQNRFIEALDSRLRGNDMIEHNPAVSLRHHIKA